MNILKCEDYFIIKVRFYASRYYLKKFHNDEPIGIKKHWEAAKNHTEFFWNFIEKVTKKSHEDYINEYFFSSKECAIEEIHEVYGIIIVEGEGYYKYFIPRNDSNLELVEWIKINCKNSFKILKKTYTFVKPVSTFYRDYAKNKDTTIKRKLV